MSRKCQITGKKTTSGQNRPFSLKATKRTFRPNLFKKWVINPLTGKRERMKLSAKAIKTLKKKGFIKNIFASDKTKAKAQVNKAGTGKHVKKDKLTPKQKKELVAAEEAAKIEAAKTKVDKEIEKA